MKKNKSKANYYLKWAAVFGVLGWGTFFVTVGLAALGYELYALYLGGASIFLGWFVSGYFWLRYGIAMGRSIKDTLLHRRK
jgi:hypothetical protein